MSIFLRDDVATMWRGRDPFRAAQEQTGSIYRDKEGRRTLRFEHQGRGYFLKLHQGVGWKEIFKNLAQGRLPVLGAENEYRAIRAFEQLGIDTLSVAAYGKRGNNPATQLSFLLTDELTDVESLEDFCARWPQQPPTFALKCKLIERVATIARIMHGNGINHRDFYLCHFLLETKCMASLSAPTISAPDKLVFNGFAPRTNPHTGAAPLAHQGSGRTVLFRTRYWPQSARHFSIHARLFTAPIARAITQ